MTLRPSDSYRWFEQLVHRHQHQVYGYACYYLGDAEAAADVTQEVLLKLWRHRRRIDEDRACAWLMRVTRNACVDALRRRRSYRRHVVPEADGLDGHAGGEPPPDAAAEAADFERQLQQALARLSEPYRSIVLLREVQELKYEEISGALDLPLGTVKVYLHRARKMLREALTEVFERESLPTHT